MVRLPEKGSDDRSANGTGEAPSLSALSQEVKELVRLVSATDISELHLENGQTRIIIKRGSVPLPAQSAGMVYTPPAVLPGPPPSSPVNLIGHSPAHGEEPALDVDEQLIVAPMVG